MDEVNIIRLTALGLRNHIYSGTGFRSEGVYVSTTEIALICLIYLLKKSSYQCVQKCFVSCKGHIYYTPWD